MTRRVTKNKVKVARGGMATEGGCYIRESKCALTEA